MLPVGADRVSPGARDNIYKENNMGRHDDPNVDDKYNSENEIPRWRPCTEESEKPKKKSISKVGIVIAILALAASAVGILLCFVADISSEQKDSSAVTDTAASESTADSVEGTLDLTDTSTYAQADTTAVEMTTVLDVSDMVSEVLPSVVSLTPKISVGYYGINGFIDPKNFKLSDDVSTDEITDSSGNQSNDNESGTEVEKEKGSGTIVAQNSTELLILTSYHVVSGSSSIDVTFIDDSKVNGKIKSANKDLDIAVVSVALDDIAEETMDCIRMASLATADAEVGEGVVVIGNALGYGISVTTGIISAVDRQITLNGNVLNVIQTDAAINSGNSGGCMLNSKGEVIGINEAKINIKNVEGMGYAVPVTQNLDEIQELLNAKDEYSEEESKENSDQTAYLGIRGRDVTEELADYYNMPVGVYVSATIRGSGASDAGVTAGDIIVGINDILITTMEELEQELSYFNAGDTVTLVINRQIGDSYRCITLDVVLSGR
jgi:serine protease Do